MLGWLLGRRRNQAVVDALYDRLMQAARHPVLYLEGGVPDTLEGRFDCLTLHCVLILRRLKDLPPPAADLARDLVDRLFAGFDQALREVGVGDVTIPKRMKTMASAFAGRAKAYEQAFSQGDAAFQDVLARNLLGGPLDPQRQQFWVSYLAASQTVLQSHDFESLVGPARLFPEPESHMSSLVSSCSPSGDRP